MNVVVVVAVAFVDVVVVAVVGDVCRKGVV